MPSTSRVVKHAVVSSGLHDADIRPPALLGEFKRLSVRDAAVYFAAPGALEAVSCPACGRASSPCSFEKDGFDFVECRDCHSLYVSPRPRGEILARYYAESEASRFRAAQFAEGSAAPRRYHLLRAHASWMGRMVEESGLPLRPAYADVRTFAPTLFDEVAELGVFGELHSIAPWVSPRGRCAAPVHEVSLETCPPVAIISAFEKLEHQHTPLAFLQALSERLFAGGLLFLTTRTCTGFDLQLLWDRTPYIFVPEHLNLLSITGLEQLVQRSGLELIELSTPGQLDVELVQQACAADPAIVLPRFLQTLVAERGGVAHGDFQAFLQKHRLSSHVRLVLRKPG
jgi:hypothetical protein